MFFGLKNLCSGQLAQPVNVRINISEENLLMSWDPVTNAGGYIVYEKTLALADTSFKFLKFSDANYVTFPFPPAFPWYHPEARLYRVSAYTNLPDSIVYHLGENENFPSGCEMTITLDTMGHRSSSCVINNSNREIGYQITYHGYGISQLYQDRIFQDRRVYIGETSLFFQGQADWQTNSPILEDRDLPINTWLDFNLVIYLPGMPAFNPREPFWNEWDFWDTVHSYQYYLQYIEIEYQKLIRFHMDGTFEIN